MQPTEPVTVPTPRYKRALPIVLVLLGNALAVGCAAFVGVVAAPLITVPVAVPGAASPGPFVGPAEVTNVTATCAATPTLIQVPNGQVALACECDSAVSWGDSGVAGTDYSSDTFEGNVRRVYCLAADVACRCIALTTTAGS